MTADVVIISKTIRVEQKFLSIQCMYGEGSRLCQRRKACTSTRPVAWAAAPGANNRIQIVTILTMEIEKL